MARVADSIVSAPEATRRVALSVVAALGGALLVVIAHPLVGLCVTAWGLASLVYERRPALAWMMGVLAGVLATLVARVSEYVMFLPITGVPVDGSVPLIYMGWITLSFLLVGPGAATALRKRSPFVVTGVVIVGLAAAQLLALWRLSADAGMSVDEYVLATVTATFAVLEVTPEVVGTMAELWPSLVLTTSVLTGVLAMVGTGTVARRSGATIRSLPGLAALDLSPWLTLLPIVGLALYVASTLATPVAGLLESGGVNVLIVARWVFFFQGLAVFASLFDRVKLGRTGRLIGYPMVCAAEIMLPTVSLIGLADIWLNLRRLPREGTTPREPGTPPGR